MLNVMGNPSLYSCWFSGNSTCLRGGGLYCRGGDAILIDCTFDGNSTTVLALGGGMAIELGSATLTGCVFTGNQAVSGGGLHNENGSVALTNCTFAQNAASAGKAVTCDYNGGPSSLELRDCILWDGGGEVWSNGGATVTVAYSDVQGGWAGPGNIDDDPLFVDPAGGDWHLADGSPCIDTGDPGVQQQPGELDIDGQLRVWDGNGDGPAIVDMGADEFDSPCPGDIDHDGEINLADLAQLLTNYGLASGAAYAEGDLDFDGDVDLSDLATLLTAYGTTCE